MKKAVAAIMSLFIIISITQAQTKVFKEVSEGMYSQTRLILQDGGLVGYLTFTKLEQASADSFNYKISIMDENLNDIGTVKFKEQKLLLQGVSFEQDVLCLAYLKSNIVGVEFKNRKEYRRAQPGGKSYLFTQFVNLNGKIVKSNAVPAEVKFSDDMTYDAGKGYGDGKLKHDIQIRNIAQKGFAIFYGDEKKKNLLVYDVTGKLTWQKPVGEEAVAFGMLTSGTDVYLLAKQKTNIVEGGYETLGFGTSDSTTFPKLALKDKKGNSLHVIDFENDPVTGKAFVIGNILNPRHQHSEIRSANGLVNRYLGAFTVNFNGHKKNDVLEIYSYWDDGANPDINRRGRYYRNKGWVRFEEGWKDYQGNTYLVGSSFVRKPRWSAIIFSTIMLQTLIFPAMMAGTAGHMRVDMRDAMVVKLDSKGKLSLDNTAPANLVDKIKGSTPIKLYDRRAYHHVTNAESKTDYLIVDDIYSIFIYNATQKKTARTIPHTDGNILTSIYPVKEGHVMISQFNRKEKTMRWSIEAL